MWPDDYARRHMPKASNKWQHLATAFRNLGDAIAVECENMEATSKEDEAFDALYTNYAQLLDTMKATREFISARFDVIDGVTDAKC
jgi:hypothetical protein